jgi:hypothetical protein
MALYKNAFVFLLLPSLSLATVKFNCYSLYNAPVQAYVAGSLNCDPDAQPQETLKKDGPTKVLCFYQAMCEPLAPGEKATKLTAAQVGKLQMNPLTESTTAFKPSGISCSGRGVLKGGVLQSVRCPDPDECTTDVVFTAAMAQNDYPGINAVIIKPNMKKTETGAE